MEPGPSQLSAGTCRDKNKDRGQMPNVTQYKKLVSNTCDTDLLQAPLWDHVCSTEGEDINSSETSLAS